MCFDICTINIRVSIRVRGLHLVANEDFDSNSVTCGVQTPSNLSLNMVELCLIGVLADPHCPCKDFSRAGRIRSTNGCRPISQGAP